MHMRIMNITIDDRRVEYSMGIFGIWSENRTIRHTISRVLYIIICILFNVSCCLGFYNQLETRKTAFIFSNMAILLVGGYGSIAILLQNQKSFNNWLGGMFQNEKFLNSHPNKTLRKIYRSNLRKIWPKTLFRLNKWSIIIAEAMLIGVFFLHTSKKLNVEDECVAAKDCSMIYIGYYFSPWNVDKHYWLANFENVAFGGFCCIVVYWRDMYFTCFICYLRCKIKVLSYVVGHLDEFVDDSLNEGNYFHELGFVLEQCIQEHQNIFRVFKSLDKYLSRIFGFMLLVNTLVMVNTSVLIFQKENTSSFALFVYCGAFYGCTHLFMMLSQSEELSSQSLGFAESIYSTKWCDMPIEYRKLLYIMQMRAQKPLAFTCGGLYMANLNTFMKTMKTVYTIVNALMNLNG